LHRTKVRVVEDALDANNTIARANRDDFDRASVRVVNLMSAPGAGKTSLLEAALGPGLEGLRAAVLEGDLAVFANVGDSRVYWIPDPATAAEPAELSLDDSVAQVRIAMGVSREEAENGPQAHAITKWLGGGRPPLEPGAEL